MASRQAKQADLALITKSSNKLLDSFRCAEALVTRTGYSIKELQAKAVRDRLKLSRKFLLDSQSLITAQSYRAAVGRGYYALYHMFRAVSFHVNDGDDYEAHSKLPDGVPNDFPSSATWKNNLKISRLSRNKADYEPYPLDDAKFLADAHQIVQFAKDALRAGGVYLKSKGLV